MIFHLEGEAGDQGEQAWVFVSCCSAASADLMTENRRLDGPMHSSKVHDRGVVGGHAQKRHRQGRQESVLLLTRSRRQGLVEDDWGIHGAGACVWLHISTIVMVRAGSSRSRSEVGAMCLWDGAGSSRSWAALGEAVVRPS